MLPPPSVVPGGGNTPGALPAFDPPKPDVPKPSPSTDVTPGTPIGFNKPSGTADVKPVAATAPKTDFDVDLYDPKKDDSYESISQSIYNDKRYAAALRAFNRNQQLQGGRLVELPPIYILKRRYPNMTGTPVGTGASGAGAGALPTSAQPNWGPAGGELVPVTPAAKRGVFVVPQGGMTFRQIAREKLGDGNRWGDIYNMNPHFTDTNAVLPAGTEVKLPSDAR